MAIPGLYTLFWLGFRLVDYLKSWEEDIKEAWIGAKRDGFTSHYSSLDEIMVGVILLMFATCVLMVCCSCVEACAKNPSSSEDK